MDNAKIATGIVGAIALAAGVGTWALSGDEALQPDGSFLVGRLIETKDCEGRKRCNIRPAFQRAFAACAKLHADRPRVGCKLSIPPGEFDLLPQEGDDEALRICRAHVLEGAAAGGWGAASTVWTPCGANGIRVAYHDECKAAGEGWGGDWSQIRGLAVRQTCHTTTSTIGPPNYGIILQARAHLEDVWVQGYVVGISVDADINATPRTNANLWSLERAVVNGAAHAGIRLKGGDANGGLASLLDSSSNCVHGSVWHDELGECANLADWSFLGNSYVASHVATARERSKGLVHRGYLFVGGNQRAAIIGAYGEGDSQKGLISPWSNVLGGLGEWEGWGLRQEGPRFNRLEVWNRTDPANQLRVLVGETNLPGAGFAIYSSAGNPGWPLTLNFDPTSKSWAWRVANSPSHTPIQIGGTHDAPGGLGALRLSKER